MSQQRNSSQCSAALTFWHVLLRAPQSHSKEAKKEGKKGKKKKKKESGKVWHNEFNLENNVKEKDMKMEGMAFLIFIDFVEVLELACKI